MLWDSYSDSDAGSTDSYQSSTSVRDLPDPIRPESLDTRESKVMWSTESELEEVAESDQLARVLFMESQLTKVSTNSSPRDPTEPSLKKESEKDAEISEFLTLTGLPKTEHINSTKSSLLTHSTRQWEETQELIGLPPINTSTERTEDSHQLARGTEDWESEVTEITTIDPVKSRAGWEEINSQWEDIDESITL